MARHGLRACAAPCPPPPLGGPALPLWRPSPLPSAGPVLRATQVRFCYTHQPYALFNQIGKRHGHGPAVQYKGCGVRDLEASPLIRSAAECTRAVKWLGLHKSVNFLPSGPGSVDDPIVVNHGTSHSGFPWTRYHARYGSNYMPNNYNAKGFKSNRYGGFGPLNCWHRAGCSFHFPQSSYGGAATGDDYKSHARLIFNENLDPKLLWGCSETGIGDTGRDLRDWFICGRVNPGAPPSPPPAPHPPPPQPPSPSPLPPPMPPNIYEIKGACGRTPSPPRPLLWPCPPPPLYPITLPMPPPLHGAARGGPSGRNGSRGRATSVRAGRGRPSARRAKSRGPTRAAVDLRPDASARSSPSPFITQ